MATTQKGQVFLRPFSETDLGSLHQLICETIETSYSAVYPARAVQFFKDYHSEKRIRERSKAGEIWIAETQGSLVATGALVAEEILGVFVKPDHQGRGYGKSIMTKLEGRAKEKGLSEVTLSVSLPSRKFYENLNYRVLAERSLDVGEGQHLKYWPGKKTLTS